MVVRIRWNKYRAQEIPRLQNAALAVASLLAPSALMAFTIAVWKLAANLHWTGDFFVSSGLWFCWLGCSTGMPALTKIIRNKSRFS
jgi:hypothetical protein